MFLKLFRIAVFFGFTLLFLLVGSAVNFFLLTAPRIRARAQAVMTMIWAKINCLIFGVRVKISKRQRGGGKFIVCNHIGYADIFVLGSLGPCAFLSNHEVRRWPIFGWIAALGGVVFVNRNSRRSAYSAVRELQRKIEYGVGVIVFPEGTTSDGSTVRRFKSSFFDVPAKIGIPVTPLCLEYSSVVIADVAWHGNSPLAPHFWRFAGIKRIDAEVRFLHSIEPCSKQVSAAEARKFISSIAHERVFSAFRSGRKFREAGLYE